MREPAMTALAGGGEGWLRARNPVVGPSRLPLLLRRFRLAYIKAGCRQDWRVDEPLRQLSGETPEKSDDVGRILIAESPSKLHLGHDSHRLRKGAHRAVMEIGGASSRRCADSAP